jgi:hypothetical protein
MGKVRAERCAPGEGSGKSLKTLVFVAIVIGSTGERDLRHVVTHARVERSLATTSRDSRRAGDRDYEGS